MSASTSVDKSSKKQQKKSRVSAAIVADVRDSDDGLSYQPPPGALLIETDGDTEEFDLDEIKNNEDLELWVMRIPNTIKTKHLHETQMPPPSSSSTRPLATVTRKHIAYDIFDIQQNTEDVKDGVSIGGEELLGLSCLLPRNKKDGKLYLTPTPITRHLVLKARSSLPTPDSSPAATQDPERYHHPPERLKHRFLFTGAEVKAPVDLDFDAMNMDRYQDALQRPTKERKRKAEATDTPKKSKKVKSTS